MSTWAAQGARDGREAQARVPAPLPPAGGAPTPVPPVPARVGGRAFSAAASGRQTRSRPLAPGARAPSSRGSPLLRTARGFSAGAGGRLGRDPPRAAGHYAGPASRTAVLPRTRPVQRRCPVPPSSFPVRPPSAGSLCTEEPGAPRGFSPRSPVCVWGGGGCERPRLRPASGPGPGGLCGGAGGCRPRSPMGQHEVAGERPPGQSREDEGHPSGRTQSREERTEGPTRWGVWSGDRHASGRTPGEPRAAGVGVPRQTRSRLPGPPRQGGSVCAKGHGRAGPPAGWGHPRPPFPQTETFGRTQQM